MSAPKDSIKKEEWKRKISESLRGKLPWITGKHHTDEARAKIKVKRALQVITEEHKRHISENSGRWNKGLTKETDERVRRYVEHGAITKMGKPSSKKGITYEQLYGSDRAKIVKEKISEHRKGKAYGENNPYYGKHHSEEAKRKNRLARLNRVYPVKDTSIERKIQDELSSREIGFYKHISLCEICQPDITFPDKKITIFCDGDYWHNLPNYKIRDAKQNEILRSEGWLVLRYWEYEINANIEGVVDEILDAVFAHKA